VSRTIWVFGLNSLEDYLSLSLPKPLQLFFFFAGCLFLLCRIDYPYYTYLLIGEPREVREYQKYNISPSGHSHTDHSRIQKSKTNPYST
jgi:hypothetical protein